MTVDKKLDRILDLVEMDVVIKDWGVRGITSAWHTNGIPEGDMENGEFSNILSVVESDGKWQNLQDLFTTLEEIHENGLHDVETFLRENFGDNW